MATIRVRDVRLSLIWTETSLAALDSPPPSPAAVPFAFLGSQGAYAAEFDLAAARKQDEPGLKLPWAYARQHFWEYYLEIKHPSHAIGGKAFKALVPLRERAPMKLRAPGLANIRLYADAYYYPHGFALVVTAKIRTSPDAELELQEMVDLARAINWEGKLDVTWDDGTTSSERLDEAAQRCMDRLRSRAFGTAAAPDPHPASTPFTVLTVVQGSGVLTQAPFPPGSQAHRALEAVTGWTMTKVDVGNPRQLADASLQTAKGGASSRVLYHTSRGRAIWFPDLFCPDPDPKEAEKQTHKLSCYHNNLVFASLQVESLGRFTGRVAEMLKHGESLPSPVFDRAKNAAGILGRLYGGGGAKKGTYRTASPHRHLKDNGLESDLITVRKGVGIAEALTFSPPASDGAAATTVASPST